MGEGAAVLDSPVEEEVFAAAFAAAWPLSIPFFIDTFPKLFDGMIFF